MTKPYCYHIDQFSELQPVIHRVIEYCTAMGLDMIQGDHEDAPGQLELNFTFGPAEDTADRLTTYRQVCRQVGREFGLFPCFMPKPFMGVSANGCHHNISLWQDDVNMFLPDGDDPRMPSKTGLHAIGGVLTHLRALTAITAPTVNSYRRFADAGFWAPVFADWGFQNRTTALRVSAPGRFEYRSVDSAVNPYLSMAGLLAAMRDGLDQSIDPGPPEEGNIYDAIAAGKSVARIPSTLGEALDALEADPVDPRGAARARCTTSSCTTSATSGSASSGPSPTGTSRNTSTSCREPSLWHRARVHHPTTFKNGPRLPAPSGRTSWLARCRCSRTPAWRYTPWSSMQGDAIPALEPFDLLLAMGGPMDVWQEDEHPWMVGEKAAIAALGHRTRTARASASAWATNCWPAPSAGRSADGRARDRRQRGRPHDRGPSRSGVRRNLPRTLRPCSGTGPRWSSRHRRAWCWHGTTTPRYRRCGSGPCAWGVQFHVEVGPDTVPKWAAVPEYERTLNETLGSPVLLQEAVGRHLPVMSAATADLVGAILEIAFGISAAGDKGDPVADSSPS